MANGNGNSGVELINKLTERIMSMQQLIAVLESLKGVVAALSEKVVGSVENFNKGNEKVVEQLQTVMKSVDTFENSIKGLVEKQPSKEDLNQDCNECALLKERAKTIGLLKKWLIVVAVALFGILITLTGLKMTGLVEALLSR